MKIWHADGLEELGNANLKDATGLETCNMTIRIVDKSAATHYTLWPMTMSREPMGNAGHSMLDKYQKLITEDVPAYQKRIAELEAENERLKLLVAKQQPKQIGKAAIRKEKPEQDQREGEDCKTTHTC